MTSRLTIHAGVNKTGSSAIQHFLRNNVEQLSSEGVVVPNLSMEIQPPVEGHHVWYFHERRGAPREIAKRETTQKIRDLMTHPGVKQVIVSAENLGSVDNDYAFWFIDIAKEFEDVEVIMYLRRQDDLLLSSWQQWHVKTGEDLWSWIASCLGGLGNWRRVVERWEAVLGRHRVRLRLFERNRLKNGDVVDDFCQFILGDHSAFVNDRSVAVNPSYNEAIVDLVAGGGFFKDAHDNEFYKFLEHYLDDASHRRSRESVLTIDQRLAIIARYAASNSWVREHYFASSDTPETLFALPRASDYDVVTSEDLRKEQVQMLARVLFEMHKRGKK